MNQTAYHKALYFLNQRDYTIQEMQQKLQKSFPIAEVEEVIVRLKDEKLLDDQRFVENYVSYMSNYGSQGGYYHAHKLQIKGIDPDLFWQFWQEINEDQLIERTFAQNQWRFQPLNFQQKPRIMRFLNGKGFKYQQIQNLINQLGFADE